MSYDDAVLRVGNFDRYQRKIFSVLLLPIIACAFHEMGGVFLAARGNFRCLLPYESADNATYQSPPNITNMEHPWDEDIKNWPRCKKHDPGIVSPHRVTGENLTSTPSTVKCDSFVYDKTYYTTTATTEWDLVCDNAWLKSLSESLFLLGDIPGSMVFGGLSDSYGRKTALLWGSILQLVAASLVACSPNIIVYMASRALVGSTAFSLSTIVYVTAVEMVGPQNRLTAAVSVHLTYATAYISSAVLAYFIREWRYLQISFTIPTIALLVFWWFIPESTRWLMTKGRVQEAKHILQKISAKNGTQLPPGTLDSLLINDTESKTVHEKVSVFDLLRYPNLRKKSLLLFFISTVNGAAAIGLSWNAPNLGGHDYVNFVICAAVEIPAFTSLLFVSNKWGRKTSLCGGMLLAGTSLLSTFYIPTGMIWPLILLAMIGKFGITFATGAASIFMAESYPTAIRSIGVASCLTFGRLGGTLAPHINDLTRISTNLPLLVIGSSALIAGLTSLLVPETLNVNMPESIEDGERQEKTTSNVEQDSKQLQHVKC